MKKILFMTYGHSPALSHARNQLESWGYPLTNNPYKASHVLLPVPSLEENGNVKGAGPLPDLQEQVWLFGGNLPLCRKRTVDLLQDEHYLQENAAITAHCALTRLEKPEGKAVLIIGSGRIGSALAQLLQEQGAKVTMAVRSEEKMAQARALGYTAISCEGLDAKKYDCIFNTAPAAVLAASEARCDAILVDLASVRGILGDRVQWARGLPGKEAPQASGTLIAKTVLRFALEEDTI